MAGPPFRGHSIGVMTFAVPPLPTLDERWSQPLDGEPRGLVLASGLPLLVGNLLEWRWSIESRPVFVGTSDARKVPRIAVPPVLVEPRRLYDVGRDHGLPMLLVGRLWPEKRDEVYCQLLDCQRRRVAAEVTLPLERPRLVETLDGLLRWLGTDCGLAPRGGDVRFDAGTRSPEALFAFLRLVRLAYVVDEQDRPVLLERMIRLATDALTEDPDFLEAAAQLVQLGQQLRPQELDYLRRPADDLLRAVQRTSPERGAVVLMILPVLLPVAPAGQVVEALRRTLADEFEPPRRELLARMLEFEEQGEEAVRLARESVQAHPAASNLKAVLAELLERRPGDEARAEARALWEQVLEVQPDHAHALPAVLTALVDEDPERAVELAGRGLLQGLRSATLFEALADLASREGMRERVAPLLEGVRLPGEGDARLQAAFGWVLDACGEWPRAELHYTVALDSGLPHPAATRLHARLHRPGDREFAALAFELATLAAEGEPADALERLDEACRDAEHFWPFEYLRGYAYERQGDAAAAVEHLRKAAEGSRESPEVVFLLGVVLRRLGRLEEAEAVLGRAVRRTPREGLFHLELARVLAGQGRREEARAEATLALRLRPADAVVRSFLDDLSVPPGRAAGAEAEGARGEGSDPAPAS